jgi:Holliday junction DNA helicase RuvA
MIASIEGDVLGVYADSVVINVNGIGFRVYVPAPLRMTLQVNAKVFLFTYLVVREDSLSLYGFENPEDRDFFTLLLGVNGIGPKTGLVILSTLTVDAIRRAVLSEQADLFSRVPGVGRKTGQKILLHLQGKIKGGLEEFGGATMDIDSEVLDALTGLGYSVVEAQAALQSIARDAPQDIETRLRLALQYFSD